MLDTLIFNPLNAELNSICHLLALLGAHHILHVSGLRVKLCKLFIYASPVCDLWWSQWPRGLKRGPAASRLLELRIRIPPGAWMSVCCECFVLSGRGLCDELITRAGESYRL